MPPNVHLVIHNIAGIISAVLALILTVFVLAHNRKRASSITLALALLSVAVFCVAHVLGVNNADPNMSRSILMFTVSVIFLVVFNAHCVFSFMGMNRRRRIALCIMYAAGVVLLAVYILFPDSFLLPSVPKMYFPNYYNPGALLWIMRVVFNFIVPAYFLGELIVAYRTSKDAVERNRYLYFLFALVLGYGISSIPIFLVHNIQIDPAWGMLFVFFYGIPFTYGAVRYELFDIRIVAKKAFGYALAIAGAGTLIALLNLSNRWIEGAYPGFPFWVTSLVLGIFAVVVSIFVWRRMREEDVLKYEFITTITHKFRTPLTHVKWAVENLQKSVTQEEDKAQLGYIKGAGERLVELTDMIANMSEGKESYGYNLENLDIADMARKTIAATQGRIDDKHMVIKLNFRDNTHVLGDENRIRFAVNTLIENAIEYTPDNGTVTISIEDLGANELVFKVADTGIGMPKEELARIFSKFYRGKQARLTDTEGMGIGLAISKDIIMRHHGKIWADSPGAGKGSTFAFSLPRA